MDFGSSELPISIYPCPIKAYVLRQTHKKKFSRAANLKFGFKQATKPQSVNWRSAVQWSFFHLTSFSCLVEKPSVSPFGSANWGSFYVPVWIEKKFQIDRNYGPKLHVCLNLFTHFCNANLLKSLKLDLAFLTSKCAKDLETVFRRPIFYGPFPASFCLFSSFQNNL